MRVKRKERLSHGRRAAPLTDRILSANYLAVKALEEFLDYLIPAGDLRLTKSR